MIKQEIANLVRGAIRNAQRNKKLLFFDIPQIVIERPEGENHGDYATNVAMQTVRLAKKDPMEIANILGSNLQDLDSKTLERVEAVKPGFINFFISRSYLHKELEKTLKDGDKFGQLNIGRKEKVNVEFISANPTGSLHIGNGRGAFFGDCLANILERAGYKVTREYLINDAKVNTQIRLLGKTALGQGKIYLNEYLKSKIEGLQLKTKNKSENEAGYLIAREIQKDNEEFINKKLKIKFDNWVSEENFYKKDKIKEIYQFFKNKKLVYQKEGARWLKISKFGVQKDEVILRQTGEPTYFLSDIAYHKDKFDRGFKRIINIWGADHQGHVPRIKAVSKILGYGGELDILISQMVRLKRGKLSKRKGEIITLESLIEEVGLDAARYFYLVKSLDTQMEFDVELAKERSAKSPVFYVQYAHARICSILRKAKACGQKTKKYNSLVHPSELAVIKQLIRLPEIVGDVARDYQVQRIPQYAIDLAIAFHQFYRDCKVLTKEKDLKEARLSLVLATKITLKNTLNLMGISAPEKM